MLGRKLISNGLNFSPRNLVLLEKLIRSSADQCLCGTWPKA
jgi:hypothetical protein